MFFVVGNHDLWTGPPRRATRSLKIDEQQKDKEEDREMTATERTEDVNEKQHKEATDIDSVDKLIKVHRLCEVCVKQLHGVPQAAREAGGG